MDLSSMWTWTFPLWGLFIIVLFLGGVLISPVVLKGLPLSSKKSVSFADNIAASVIPPKTS